MKMPMRIILLCLASVLLLTGCGDNGITELKAWMEQVKTKAVPRVTPISEPKVFIPASYAGRNQIDPFDPAKLLAVFARMAAANDNGKKPDFERPKEALEGFQLDTMKMVGTVSVKNVRIALIQVGKITYKATVGSWIGQNFGKVTNITDSQVNIIETVQDSAGKGDWIDRKATLELQEAKK